MLHKVLRLAVLSMLGGYLLRIRGIRNVAGAFSSARIIRHKPPSFMVSPSRRFLSKSDEMQGSVHKHEDKLVKMQKETSSANRTEIASPSDDNDAQKRFLKHQQAVFDDMSSYFSSNEATPEEVVPVMQELSRRIVGQIVQAKQHEKSSSLAESEEEGGLPTFQVCDIGCGTGALLPFLFEAADEKGVALQVTGVDLSPRMSALATKKRDNEWLQSYPTHNASFITRDFVSLILGDDYQQGDGVENDETVQHRSRYDAVISNACFANFYNMNALLTAMTQCIHDNGMLFVTHPLGSDFVRKLHEEDSSTVPHLLPSKSKIQDMAMFQPLELVDFVEDMEISDKSSCPVYFCSSKRTPHRRLHEVMRLRGKVDTGYGRGGKKLGFPTANLPSSLFQNALEHVSTGVYFGWALIEADASGDNDVGRNTLHKAAVNVGYSPTFEGQENQEKIIEAHLILDDETLSDFYDETMRLLLVGFLRPEKKFESFPALMAAITNDVKNAKAALDLEQFASFQQDPLFGENSVQWIGKSGGDATASWEFQPFSKATEECTP